MGDYRLNPKRRPVKLESMRLAYRKGLETDPNFEFRWRLICHIG